MNEAISYYGLMIIGYLAHDILALILDLLTKRILLKELKRINISRKGKLFNVWQRKNKSHCKTPRDILNGC